MPAIEVEVDFAMPAADEVEVDFAIAEPSDFGNEKIQVTVFRSSSKQQTQFIILPEDATSPPSSWDQ